MVSNPFVMKKNRIFSNTISGALVLLLIGFGSAPACTTFVLRGNNHVYFGRNFDWDSEDALVIVNPRGIQKNALVLPGTAAVRWTSKYGSLTFNSAGWDMPTGGMNEKGLVVEDMWLTETQCPKPDARPGINPLQWMQYQLDNFSTVDEVLASDKNIRVDSGGLPIPIHYLICDADGNSAVIEFLDGKMASRRGDSLPYAALANDTYKASAAHAKAHPEAQVDAAKNYPSVDRFACAAGRAAAFQPGTPEQDVKYAFETLAKVAQGNYTVWRLVYDVTGRQIHYRTRSQPQERVLDLKKLDFTCRGPVHYFDLRAAASKTEEPQFDTLSETKHRQYLEHYLTQGWVKQQLGDMTPLLDASLANLRTYRVSEPDSAGAIVLIPEMNGAGSLPAEEILKKALEARGGSEAAAKVRSYRAEGMLDLPWLKNSPFEMSAMRPDKSRLTAELKASKRTKEGRFEHGTDGKSAWDMQPGGPCQQLQGKRLEEMRHEARFFAEIDEPADCQSATCLGETTFEGKRCYLLRLAKKSGQESLHYFDAKTFLLAGTLEATTLAQNISVWMKSSYSEYQAFGGLQFATRIRANSQFSDATLRIQSVEVNGLDASVFKMPAAGAGAGR